MRKSALAFGLIGFFVLAGLSAARAEADAEFHPPDEPAKIVVKVLDEAYPQGATVRMTVDLEPIEGVKINRYPKVKMRIGVQPGVVEARNAEVGDPVPPLPGKEASNYFQSFDPLALEFQLDPGLAPGTHEIAGKVTYFYCMPASGFCAPKKAGFPVMVTIR